jgi:hypothetical protein
MKQTYHEHCQEQIFRLAGQREWPDPKLYSGAVDDLTVELERVSKGEWDFAKRLVDKCKSGSDFCPHVNDIAAVAAEMREAQHASGPSQQQQWRKQYGPPQPFDAETGVDWNRVHAVLDRHDRLWRLLRAKLHVSGFKWPDWTALANAADELGYHDYAFCWRRSGPDAALWRGWIPETVLAKCGDDLGVLKNSVFTQRPRAA